MKIKFLLLFLITFFLFNCSSDADSLENIIDDESIIELEKVAEMKSQNERKLAYRLLSDEEKFYLWDNKLSKLINENYLYGIYIDLTEDEKSLLKEIKGQIELSFFNDSQSDKKAFFKNVYIPQFIDKSKETFSNKYLIGFIFYDISMPISKKIDINNLNDLIQYYQSSRELTPIGGGGGNSCDCDTDAFFSCKWGDDYCVASSCSTVHTDCGFLWLSDCDGICAF